MKTYRATANVSAEDLNWLALHLDANLGTCGRGLDPLHFLELAAMRNHVVAQVTLAIMLRATDPAKAAYWLQQAAKNENAQAQYLLGVDAMATSTRDGLILIARAAANGDSAAVHFLANGTHL
jgi:TPR repeat protein